MKPSYVPEFQVIEKNVGQTGFFSNKYTPAWTFISSFFFFFLREDGVSFFINTLESKGKMKLYDKKI